MWYRSRVWLGDTPPGDPCNYVIVRTYRITDACDNITDITQTFTINDNVNPIIICPNDITGEGCDDSDVLAISGLAYSTVPVVITETVFEGLDGTSDASDNCGIREINYVDVITNPSCPLIIQRTFTAIDSCNNTASCTQVITVQDTQDPTIVCPSDITYEGCYATDLAGLTGLAYSTTPVLISEAVFESLNGRRDIFQLWLSLL